MGFAASWTRPFVRVEGHCSNRLSTNQKSLKLKVKKRRIMVKVLKREKKATLPFHRSNEPRDGLQTGLPRKNWSADCLCSAAGGERDHRRGSLPQLGVSEATFYRWKEHSPGWASSRSAG